MSQLSSTVPALRTAFGDAVERAVVSCGDTIVYVRNDRAHAVPGTGTLSQGTVRCGQSVRLTLPPLAVLYLRPT